MADIDRAALEQFLRDVGPAAAKRLAGVFATEARRRIGAVAALSPAGASQDLRREAHSLKSAARTYGAAGIARAALALEAACDRNRTEEIAPLAKALIETVERDLPLFEAAVAAQKLPGPKVDLP